MFSHRTEVAKADLLAKRLVGGATEAASVIMEELGKRYRIVLQDEKCASQFIIEVMVFYMHLVDRAAFAHLGAAGRLTFIDRFVETVSKESLRDLKGVPADDFERSLRNTYNRRQMQCAKYASLVPKEGEPPKDTLYWEFSKVLFSFLNDTNPATLIFLSVRVARITDAMVNDSLKVEEVLRS
jgi:hypothetical protein